MSLARWEAVLLAAGASRRMGRLKALLPWCGSTLIEHQIKELMASRIDRVVVVLGAFASYILERIDMVGTPDQVQIAGDPSAQYVLAKKTSVKVVINERWEEGKALSIRTGIEALNKLVEKNVDDPRPRHVLIAAVDQPTRAEVIDVLLAHHYLSDGLVTVPSFQGKRGHPVAFDGRCIPDLMRLNEESQGLRGLIRRLEKQNMLRLVEVASPSVLWNFNRPEDMVVGSLQTGRGTEEA